MAKARSKANKKVSLVFDKGLKFVSKSFIAFFLFSSDDFFSNFTIIASKKVGNAVVRNRSKRRLRELIRLYIKPQFPNLNLILIARKETYILSFSELVRDCNNLIKIISKKDLV